MILHNLLIYYRLPNASYLSLALSVLHNLIIYLRLPYVAYHSIALKHVGFQTITKTPRPTPRAHNHSSSSTLGTLHLTPKYASSIALGNRMTNIILWPRHCFTNICSDVLFWNVKSRINEPLLSNTFYTVIHMLLCIYIICKLS